MYGLHYRGSAVQEFSVMCIRNKSSNNNWPELHRISTLEP